MKKNSFTILIIEKSDIIRRGLSRILVDKNNTPLVIEESSGGCDLLFEFVSSTPIVLIATPEIFTKNEKLIDSLREKQSLYIVGLVYTYYDPVSLNQFDALIHLNDSPSHIQGTINGLLHAPMGSKSHPTSVTLTKRENEVLKLIVSGYTTKMVAETLFLSTHTVNAHRKNVMNKLDIKTVSGLTIYAVLNNIITLKES